MLPMRGALAGPRMLLRRLREVMAEPEAAQARLDKIVVHIAHNMIAEVCSVYVLRGDGRLELFATEGLNREAVHLTMMRAGEGLVGLIAESAESLALDDARVHPAFSYRAETGEEMYNSFLGVPILRGGNTLGVLVVQNRARRIYTEEEIEVLQTTAMLIAEMIASGELQALANIGDGLPATRRPISLVGTPLAEGVGLGYVVMHEPRIVIQQIVAEDLAAEERRLETAVEAVRASIDSLVDRSDQAGPGEHREILETFRMFANDRGWLRRLREAVMTGLTAEAAVERVQNEARARMQRSSDPFLRERFHDLDDLANRVLHELTGQTLVPARENLPDNAIVVARSMGAAALLDYDRKRLRGLVLEHGGATSHVAIVARALGIPAVGDIEGVLDRVENGDAIIVEGSTGDVQVRPPADVESAYAEKARLRARRQEQYHDLRAAPAQTLDGVVVDLCMNAGLLVDMPHVEETGAQGIGLFRTELQFMIASRLPRMPEQLEFYRAVLDLAGDVPVTFRTLDIGGDKVLPYVQAIEEANPALGWRALRIGLDRPALLRAQIRAMLRAAGARPLKIMFPMVAQASEFEAARALVQRELAHAGRHNYPLPATLDLGVMVEVPSLLWQLDEVLERADFLSVGSNDLLQYLTAADRDNKRVSGRYDALAPHFLRALKHIVDTAQRSGKSVTLCGEMGGRPLEALALVGLGYRCLSMSPSSIGPVKAAIRAADHGELAAFLDERLHSRDGVASLRPALTGFAEAKGIPL